MGTNAETSIRFALSTSLAEIESNRLLCVAVAFWTFLDLNK